MTLKITLEHDGEWWDWTVEGDENARGPYCGAADTYWHAFESIASVMQAKKRNPYRPNVRTEY